MENESMLSRCLYEFQAREVHEHLLARMDLASHGSEYRLLKLLHELTSGMDSVQSAAEPGVRVPFKQWEIAELLGITPEHTSRIIRRLEQEGLVRRDGRILFLSRRERLLSFIER
jgi:CRP-like cAMP-binding protein